MRSVVWRAVKGYEGNYDVSSQGAVRSCKRKVRTKTGVVQRRKGRVLRHGTDRNGGKFVLLSRQGKVRNCKIHLLVLEAFVGARPAGLDVVFKDNDRSNCAVTNLSYGKVAAADKNYARGERHGHAKLSPAKVILIRGLYPRVTQQAFAKIFGVEQVTIFQVIHDKTWKDVTSVRV